MYMLFVFNYKPTKVTLVGTSNFIGTVEFINVVLALTIGSLDLSKIRSPIDWYWIRKQLLRWAYEIEFLSGLYGR